MIKVTESEFEQFLKGRTVTLEDSGFDTIGLLFEDGVEIASYIVSYSDTVEFFINE